MYNFYFKTNQNSSLLDSAAVSGSNGNGANNVIISGSITSTEIMDGSLTTSDLSSSAGILGSQIASSTIESGNIDAGAVLTAAIGEAQVTNPKIAENAISGSNGGVGVVTNILAGSITATEIQPETISNALIAASAVSGSNAPAGSVSNIALNSITTSDISPSAGILGSQLSSSLITVSNDIPSFSSVWGNPGSVQPYRLCSQTSGYKCKNYNAGGSLVGANCLQCNFRGNFETDWNEVYSEPFLMAYVVPVKNFNFVPSVYAVDGECWIKNGIVGNNNGLLTYYGSNYRSEVVVLCNQATNFYLSLVVV